MKRMKVMFGQRRIMILATLAILVLAAAALAASSASFTATSANPGNMFASGDLAVTTDPVDGTAVLNAVNMAPGDKDTATVTVENTGSVWGTFSLAGAVTDTTDVNFANALHLTIVEDGDTANPIVDDKPMTAALAAGIPLTGNSPWDSGESHVYGVTVSFPNGAQGADNGFMNDSVEFRLDWDAVSVPTP